MKMLLLRLKILNLEVHITVFVMIMVLIQMKWMNGNWFYTVEYRNFGDGQKATQMQPLGKERTRQPCTMDNYPI